MDTIVLRQQSSRFNQFEDHCDDGFIKEDSLNDNTHSIYVKNFVDTSDSHSNESQADSVELIEDSIMNWFGMKGIANGNPEDVVEKLRDS